MGVLYQVNGPFVVYVSGGKTSSGAKLALGISRGPGRITVNHFDNPIMADNGGNRVPVDIQNMGKDANIRVSLSQVDPDVLDLLSVRGGADTPGALGTIGKPMAANGETFRVHIPSAYRPWTFWNCILRPRNDALGSEFSIIDLDFYAFAAIGSTVDPAKTKLFTHTF